MKRIIPPAIAFFWLVSAVFAQSTPAASVSAPAVSVLAASAPTPAVPVSKNTVAGIWENKSRFVEFSSDSRMRIILKPYYAFVYEDTGWLSYTETPALGILFDLAPSGAQAAPNVPTSAGSIVAGAGTNPSAGKEPGGSPPAGDEPPVATEPLPPAIHSLAVRYSREKYDQLVPAAIIGDGMFFRFYRKVADSADPAAIASSSASGASSSVSPGRVSSDIKTALQGFWLAAGNADDIRLYRSEPINEFYSYYFDGDRYYRIRYWAADVRYRNLAATFDSPDGSARSIPKFIPMDSLLYTCITSTGTKLRNFEHGTFSIKDGAITLKPENVVFEGTAATVAKPLRIGVSSDGLVLAFGEPYLIRSKIADLDAEIKAHNGLRRPPRKPVFGYMDLDFRWDEIDSIRNNGRSPEGN